MAIYGFDRHPYMRSSNAAPYDPPPAKPVALVAGELQQRLSEMDDHQLAALYIAIETEHINRMAAHAGYSETSDEVF